PCFRWLRLKPDATRSAVCFLCHCPSSCPDRALPGALPSGVRTFLSHFRRRREGGNDRLACCGGYLSIGLLADSVLLEFLVEIAARRPDDFRRLRDVPVVLTELADEKRPLGRLLELAQRARALLFAVAGGGARLDADDVAQVVGVDRVAGRHDDQTLGGVLETAAVALPPGRRRVL